MKKIFEWFQYPPVTGTSSTIIIRLMAGAVFFFEGILKFLYANQGTGRFAKLGFPFHEATAQAIATGEIIGGLLLLSGLFTRFVSIYFILQMVVAVLSTKISLYSGKSPLPMPVVPPRAGIWAVEHESRSDYAQIIACLFLLIEGPGRVSLDFMIAASKKVYRFNGK
jgi:putative oxidoreductase